ncbi:hypothetical protein OIU79_014228 [Salix purpurea]|uniref:Uncharacterized protein n=1 Tax=Salix purpurea TaxID=77065 RepID=A0A9Q0PR01_SALPP|nr:hypothetical protein OIU79_014228 [Salix purpurea]
MRTENPGKELSFLCMCIAEVFLFRGYGRAQLPRSSAPRHRLRPPPSSAPRLQSRRLSFAPSRNLGELGCMHCLMGGMEKMGDACGLTVSQRRGIDATIVLEEPFGLALPSATLSEVSDWSSLWDARKLGFLAWIFNNDHVLCYI